MCEYCATDIERKPIFTESTKSNETTLKLVDNMLSMESQYTVVGSNLMVKTKARPFFKYCPMCGALLKGKYSIGDNVLVFNGQNDGQAVSDPHIITDYKGANVVLENGEVVKPKFLIKG